MSTPLRERRWVEALVVAGVVLLGSALACRWALSVNNWRVMTDEMLYVKAAQAVVDNPAPYLQFRGERISNYGLLYPALLAPLVALFDPATFFRVAHAMGAVLLASTAVPTYLTARYVSRSRHIALVAAVPAALAPWLLFSLNLMTEALAAPLLAWAVYAFVCTVAEPSVRRDVLALVAVVALVLTRTQFIFMPGVLVLAIVLHEVGMRLSGGPRRWPRQVVGGLRASVRDHLLLAVASLLAGLALVFFTSTSALVGDYSVAVGGTDLVPPGFLRAFASHVTLIVFGIAAVPLVLTLAYVAEVLWTKRDRRAHAFVACLVVVLPALTAVATSFDLRFAGVVQERYVFYVAPLLLAASACFVGATRRPFPAVAGASVLATVIIVAASGLVPTIDVGVFYSPARPGWVPFNGYIHRAGAVVGVDVDAKYVLVAGALVASFVLAWLLTRGRRSLALLGLGIGLSAWTLALTLYAGPRVFREHEALAIVGNGGDAPLGQRSWIDDAVGEDADVGIAPAPIVERLGRPTPVGGVTNVSVWWQVEYWNRSVRSSFKLDGAQDFTPYALRPMTIERGTGRLSVSDGPEARYLAVARGTHLYGIAGREVTRTQDLRLIRPERPYRATWATQGLDDAATLLPNTPATLSAYGPRSGPPRQVSAFILIAGQTLKHPLTTSGGGRTQTSHIFGRRRLERRWCVAAGSRGRARFEVKGPNELRLIGVRVRLGRTC